MCFSSGLIVGKWLSTLFINIGRRSVLEDTGGDLEAVR